MDEPVHCVTKAEAAEELKISLSTLDRRIRTGEIEVRREGRRVYVLMHGPEYLGDDELLRRALARKDELQRTVRELERGISELQRRASELRRERDEARQAAAASQQPYWELQRAHRKEIAEHEETTVGLNIMRVFTVVLLALLIGSVLLWWFVLR